MRCKSQIITIPFINKQASTRQYGKAACLASMGADPFLGQLHADEMGGGFGSNLYSQNLTTQAQVDYECQLATNAGIEATTQTGDIFTPFKAWWEVNTNYPETVRN